ncbi:hypothetical protein Q4S45_15980 [Massilia sp. R2A-15]|uniref:hypothetical protein n=1 Tax=Massilia sp. R2A-15 TaxID=3064278 RepID=UPI0027367871|nr:hypothetical protein [Massilia sp. R2A-15]WLI88224.1 hypothetical protein Q4S45_15980 [Massilia sp. R2A-15]
MPNISEKDLAVFISLLSSKIVEMKHELRDLQAIDADDASDEEIENQCEIQECIEQYDNILGGVREEYEAGLVDEINLPSYEALTKASDSTKLRIRPR